MRILHLDAGREMRGGQWQVLRLIEGLASAGVESTLLARPRAPLFDAARKQGWRVEPWSLIRPLSLARNFDLVHAHDARSHTLGAIIPYIPLVVSRRVAFGEAVPRSALSKWKYSRPARFIAVSEHVKSVLIQRGVAAGKITVVYDGVVLLPDAGPSGNPPRVLAPANATDPAKGAALAAEATQLAGLALEFGADLERDLAHAAIFVYITYSEGLGSGALLAMSAGVPVIASNIGGLPEIVRDGETGLLVPNDAAAIAAAIRKLAGDPELRRRMGFTARQIVSNSFTVDHMVRRTMEVYRQVLS